MHALEERLSPRYLRLRSVRKAKGLAWRGTAKLLEFAQRRSVQVSLLGGLGGGALLMVLGSRKAHNNKSWSGKKAGWKTGWKAIVNRKQGAHPGGAAAKAVGTGALWMTIKRGLARKESSADKAAVSGVALAATAAKAFLTGARASRKKGTTQPGRKVAWRGLATAIGAALGSYWYSHRRARV